MKPASVVLLLTALLAGTALGGCKLVKNAAEGEAAAASSQAAAEKGSSLDAKVDAMWASRVLPLLRDKAVALEALVPAIRQNLDAAGEVSGFRQGGEGAPWTFATRFAGRIVGANTATRAATAAIDIDGDGNADATVQLGPVIRGTALRDALPFVSFSDFADQIEFASFSRALNSRAYDEAMASIPRDDLQGTQVSGIGAFTMRRPGDEILITPVEVTVGPAP